jgi:head-tail adaptor
MSPIAIGRRDKIVVVQTPGPAVPDGDGGYTHTWADANPRTWHVSIEPATTRDLERVAAGTVIATASHLVTGPYRPDLTTQTRLLFGARVFNVTGIANPSEKNEELILVCVEVVM